MFEDDEDIYDDTAEEMSIANKPVSALLSRFEQHVDSPSKPVLNPKPAVKPKYGGGPGLNIASANDRKDVAGSNVFKPKVGIDKPNVDEKEKNSSGGWQPKKREIPAMFKGGTGQSDADDKPKTALKPVPKWQKNDTKTDNKNDTNNNTNATVNGVTTPAAKPDLPIGKKTPGKLNIEAKFGGLNFQIPKQIGASGPGTGTVSPRIKPAEVNIPKQENKSAEVPPATPKDKPAKFGASPGVNVLQKVSGTSGPIDFRSRLKPAAERKSVHIEDNDSVQLRNAASKFGPRVSLKRVSITTVVRTSDGKKFQKTNKKSLDDQTSPPVKPVKVDFDVDLEILALDYKFALEELDAADKESHGFTEYEEEEFYDDCGNLAETRKKSRVVSLMGSRPKPKPRQTLRKAPPIPIMTEEEEAEWNDNGFPAQPEESLPPPPLEMLQEDYDDVGIAPPGSQVDDDPGELYEALSEPEDEEPPSLGPKPSNAPPPVPSTPLPASSSDKSLNEKPKDSKELEKERKRKEKEEKELLKKKEKELKKLTKLLKVTPEILTQTVGQGKVKANAKGKEKSGELSLTAGEQVDIIRMVNNPRGKWLIRVLSTEKAQDHGPYSPMELIGYCDENNIEYMKNSAAEKKNSTSSAPPEEPQETYEDVDGGGVEDAVADEIYEECN